MTTDPFELLETIAEHHEKIADAYIKLAESCSEPQQTLYFARQASINRSIADSARHTSSIIRMRK